ncbi:MAG: OmpA family protein, partial [Gemmatimonadetes bacterium]|nr:OmpA family protein [Gemmatimonadota bacterium]
FHVVAAPDPAAPAPAAAAPPPAAPVPEGRVKLRLGSRQDDFLVDYRVEIENHDVPLENLRLTLVLPDGIRYMEGTTVWEGTDGSDPEVGDGTLVYRTDHASGTCAHTLTFRASVARDRAAGDLVTRGMLTFDTPAAPRQRSEVVQNVLALASAHERIPKPDVVVHPHFATLSHELRPEDRAELDAVIARLRNRDILHIHASGHSDARPIPAHRRSVYADNYALSTARAETVARYIARALELPENRITVFGYGPDLPLDRAPTREAYALNRRVGLRFVTDEVRDHTELRAVRALDEVVAATRGASPEAVTADPRPAEGAADPGATAAIAVNRSASLAPPAPALGPVEPSFLDGRDPGWAWHWPPPEHSPPIPSVKILVQHPPDAAVALYRNGERVPALNFDETLTRADGTVSASLWTGVDLEVGDNRFVARRVDDGSVQLEHTVHYSGPPVRAEFVEARSVLAADGLTPPRIAIRLYDQEGHPARPGVIGEFSVDPPHRARQELESLRNDPLSGGDGRRVRYMVGPDGIALLELQPTARPGEAILRVPFREREQEFRVWLASPPRDWILVGLAEGEAGYRELTGRVESLDPDLDADFWTDGRIAFYAKGRVRGDWLLTLAVDTERDPDDRTETLGDVIDPDAYYTLYGDATEQDYDAASREKLYVRIERDRFVAQFGDMETGLTYNELARYDRRL